MTGNSLVWKYKSHCSTHYSDLVPFSSSHCFAAVDIKIKGKKFHLSCPIMSLHFVSTWLKWHNCLYAQHPENVNRCQALKSSPDRSLIWSWKRLMRATADVETRSGWLIKIILCHTALSWHWVLQSTRGIDKHLLVRKAPGLIYNWDASLTSFLEGNLPC